MRVVLVEGGEAWAAQILEYDIACQAKRLKDRPAELKRTIRGHILVSRELGLDLFADLGRAPHQHYDLWERDIATPTSVEAPAPFSFQSELRVADLQPA